MSYQSPHIATLTEDDTIRVKVKLRPEYVLKVDNTSENCESKEMQKELAASNKKIQKASKASRINPRNLPVVYQKKKHPIVKGCLFTAFLVGVFYASVYAGYTMTTYFVFHM